VDPDPYQDPDSVGSLDPDPKIRIRIQESKNYPQKYKKVNKFHFLKSWMFSFEG
jgi:hypothetical protein